MRCIRAPIRCQALGRPPRIGAPRRVPTPSPRTDRHTRRLPRGRRRRAGVRQEHRLRGHHCCSGPGDALARSPERCGPPDRLAHRPACRRRQHVRHHSRDGRFSGVRRRVGCWPWRSHAGGVDPLLRRWCRLRLRLVHCPAADHHPDLDSARGGSEPQCDRGGGGCRLSRRRSSTSARSRRTALWCSPTVPTRSRKSGSTSRSSRTASSLLPSGRSSCGLSSSSPAGYREASTWQVRADRSATFSWSTCREPLRDHMRR